MKRFILMLTVLLVLFVFVPAAFAQGETDPVSPLDWLRDPAVLAGVIMIIYPQLFDLFEQFMIARGWDKYISGPNRKRLLAWFLAAPVALLVQLLAAWVFHETFTLDSVQALAMATIPYIIGGQVSYMAHRATGTIISGRAELLDGPYKRAVG